jgi:hypothetical protein
MLSVETLAIAQTSETRLFKKVGFLRRSPIHSLFLNPTCPKRHIRPFIRLFQNQ